MMKHPCRKRITVLERAARAKDVDSCKRFFGHNACFLDSAFRTSIKLFVAAQWKPMPLSRRLRSEHARIEGLNSLSVIQNRERKWDVWLCLTHRPARPTLLRSRVGLSSHIPIAK